MPVPFEPDKSREWKLLNPDFSLDSDDAEDRARHLPSESGIYLWTIKFSAEEYCLYIGKTKRLSRRIGDYAKSFQLHSPNDRKIFFAQMAIKAKTDATFPLYFQAANIDFLNKAEKSAIDNLSPILNAQNQYAESFKPRLKNIYFDLYAGIVHKHLDSLELKHASIN